MPIRWSALKVSEAADMIEGYVKQAVEPLEQARLVAGEARKIANLPQYLDQDFCRLLGEIGRAIGGDHFEPVGRLRSAIESIRKALPSGGVEAEWSRLKNGTIQQLM